MSTLGSRVELEDLWSRYDGESILRGLTLTLEPGRIYGLVGENGSGKTTLGRILQGLIVSEKGSIRGLGTFPRRHNRGKIDSWVQTVPQHPKTFPGLTIGDFFRLVAGRVPKNEITSVQLSSLSMSGLSLLGIRAAIATNPRLLFLDETTAPMGPEEVKIHYETLRTFTDQGGIALVVSHRIQELLELTDGIFVLRHGRLSGFFLPSSRAFDLSHAMFGSPLEKIPEGHSVQEKEPTGTSVLRISELPILGKKLSFDLLEGEIHCILGMKEHGLEILEDSLSGLLPDVHDRIEPKPWNSRSGFSYIPRDRYRRALFPGLSVDENYRIHGDSETPPSLSPYWLHQPIQNLSGGMAQRLVLDREIPRARTGLVVCEPGIGLDQTHRSYLHRALVELRQKGRGILLLTSDPDEAMGVGDRISVLYDGEIIACRKPSEDSREFFSDCMVGLYQEFRSTRLVP